MGTVARGAKLGGGTNFNDGQVIDPTEVNTDFNTLYTEINGGLDDANIETATIPGAKSFLFSSIPTPAAPTGSQVKLYNASGQLTVQSSGGQTYWPGYHQAIGLAATGRGVLGARFSSQLLSSQTGADTTETTIGTATFPAAGFWGGATASTSGSLHLTCGGTTAANTNTKRIRVYVGGTSGDLIFDSGAVAANGDTWLVRSTILDGGTATTTGYAFTEFRFHDATTGVVYSSTSFTTDWTAAQAILVTGTNGTASAGDIVGGFYILEYNAFYAT